MRRLTGYAVATLRLFADKRRLEFDHVRFAPSRRLEHPDTHSCRECGPKIFTALQIVWADDLGCQDRLRSLRMGADDQRFGNGFEPPSGCNTLNLTGRVVTIAAGADQRRVGTPANPIECRI